MANVYKTKLDIKNVRPSFKPVFVQYDHAQLEIELLDNARTYDLSSVERVEFTHVRGDNLVIIQSGDIVTDDSKKIIRYEYQGSEMDLIGTIKTSFAVFDADNKKVSSHSFDVVIVEDLRDDIFEPAEPNFGKLQTLIKDVADLKTNGGGNGIGLQGPRGEPGYTPIKGVDYFDGKDGEKGEPFTYADFTPSQLEALRGPRGSDGKDGVDGKPFTFEDFTAEQLASLKGERGERGLPGYTPQKNVDYFDGTAGKDGTNGIDGKSAYQIAVSNGYVGTEAQWLASLKGETGPAGSTANITAHESSDAPHQYGGKFEWRYNAATNSLDLVVLP